MASPVPPSSPGINASAETFQLSSTPSARAALFADEATAFVAQLRDRYYRHLSQNDDAGVLAAIAAADSVHRAQAVYEAAEDISAAPGVAVIRRGGVQQDRTAELSATKAYLVNLARRLYNALRRRDVAALTDISAAAEQALDNFCDLQGGAFRGISAPVQQDPYDPFAAEGERLETNTSVPYLASVTHEVLDFSDAKQENLSRGCYCLPFSNIGKRNKVILWLYILVAIGAIIAVAVVTADFIKGIVHPESFMRSIPADTLVFPVITACLSQTGIPFSRLQLFNYSDAQGNTFVGGDPMGPDRASPKFKAVVERFWDNPDDENCKATLGDFIGTWDLNYTNDLAAGRAKSKCRPCYRVGRDRVEARSTEFSDSAILMFYTDDYYLQCTRRAGGVKQESLELWHQDLLEKADKMEKHNVLLSRKGSVSDLDISVISKITPAQACGLYYFAFFPKVLGLSTNGVDIQYTWNGTDWEPTGNGPYFEPPTENADFFPEVSQRAGHGFDWSQHPVTDVNTRIYFVKTYATFRSVSVYNDQRFDITTSSSSLFLSNVKPMFGYWLAARIYANYNRFVISELYEASTYPTGQWLIDASGYLSLFSGASLFSILLLPLMRTVRRREVQRLKSELPEAYLWSKHRQRYRDRVWTTGPFGGVNVSPQPNVSRRGSAALPRYSF